MRIIGHRGARGEAPENTLGGFSYLKDLGITAVEFDVRQLNDDTLVVMHDDNFLRTTGVEHELYAIDANELQRFNQAAIWLDWQHQDTPRLDQALALMTQFEHIEVEVKAVNSLAAAKRLVTSLTQQLKGFEHNAVITSFDHKILHAVQQQNSGLSTGLLIEDAALTQPIALALSLGCCQIGWMDQLATDEKIAATQAAGLKVSVWTVNDFSRLQHLQNLAVDGVITDLPKYMLQQLN
ncbi:glycerophosphodiester phosphodiesterase [Acinetobacter pullicarnis]|uniref:glycerophosphodiester phosphodiesterase n=1 Tax=Acinetobacter pullicarnis TaxID=2576829 RepID=UPI0011206E48|nr:glycerophosphodiester phosphodiesterase [Acinetobacter pullicarnis]